MPGLLTVDRNMILEQIFPTQTTVSYHLEKDMVPSNTHTVLYST